MILKRPSFRRGGNSGIAMLRQRYQRGSNQNFLNPGKSQTVADFYKQKGERMEQTGKVLQSFLKLTQEVLAHIEDMIFLKDHQLLLKQLYRTKKQR